MYNQSIDYIDHRKIGAFGHSFPLLKSKLDKHLTTFLSKCVILLTGVICWFQWTNVSYILYTFFIKTLHYVMISTNLRQVTGGHG